MFLKSLEIFGFKSFAERTRIEFADGITALLGPNGCGKSNVVDAIKWVLGEQASKSLRAEAMEDVIFNGTESRKALNVAEVTLTLANDHGQLALDLPEVVVRRRLYRSGESEYFINGTLVKLKDIRELFFDTGIGKSAYSIMEQGKIDQVLSNKPEERRHLFEEAAGITKYRIRGAEAERKLERTDDNMRQVEGILGEVRRSYDTLRKQADKTRRYREVRDELFQLEVIQQLYRLREAMLDNAKREETHRNLANERDSLKASIDTVNETLEENIGEVSSLEARLLETQKALYALELDKNNNENQLRLFQERSAELKQKLAADMAREEGLARKVAAIEDDNAQRRKAIDDLQRGIADVDSNIARLENAAEQARSRSAAIDTEQAALALDMGNNETLVDSAQDELRELTDAIVGQLDASLANAAGSTQERKELEARFRSDLQALAILIDGRRALVNDARALGEGAGSRALDAAAQALSDCRQGLSGLEQRFSDYQAAIPAFLDEFLAPEGTLTRKRELDTRLADLRRRISDGRSRSQALKDEQHTLAQRQVEIRDQLEDLRVSRVRLAAQVQALEEQLERSATELAGLGRERAELQAAMAEDQGRINGLAERSAALQTEREQQVKNETSFRASLVELEKGITNRNKAVMSKEKELKEKIARLGVFQERLEKASVALAESQAEIRNLHANFRERHSRDLKEFEAQTATLPSDLKDVRESSSTLRDELKNLGSVNLMALEEFAEVKERYDFLTGQLDDLRKAKEDLVKVTSEIRNESGALFKESYEKIRVNFQVLYRRLFGGGRGELRLSDPDNVLESGIEIYAQPPGKKLENIALLSGGERALTAVALLFATYQVKPSPFCLLDEIDAALDENNVGRFVTTLMEFAGSSQFIVITHNKKTVTGARSLLGVTMQESGVSRIVAIRVAEEERHADYRRTATANAEAKEPSHGQEP